MVRWREPLSALALCLGACDGGGGQATLRPEGPPEILQLFVIDGDGRSKLAAGHHCDIDGVSAFEGEICVPAAPSRFGDLAGPVDDAALVGQELRLVFDELLAAGTVEVEESRDVFHLRSGAVDLRCALVAVPATEDAGFYSPGGDQSITMLLGSSSLGPALVIRPARLPAGQACTITVAPTVTDLDGNRVTTRALLGFHTGAPP